MKRWLPILLFLMMLLRPSIAPAQLMFGGELKSGQAAGGDLGGTLPKPSVTKLNGNAISATVPTAGQFLLENAAGTSWAPFSLSGDATGSASTPGQVTVGHFTLSSNSSAGNQKITNLAGGTNANEAMPNGVAAGGDLGGTLPGATVAKLNGNPIVATGPTAGQFLVQDTAGATNSWAPFSLSGDATGSAATPGQVNVGHFSLTKASSAHGFAIQNLTAPVNTNDALSEGNPIGAVTSAAATFTSVTANPFITKTSNPASAGTIRLATSDQIAFRNSANVGDIVFVRSSNDAKGEVWLGDANSQAVVTKASGIGIPAFAFNGEAVTDLIMVKRATDQFQLLRGDTTGNGIEIDTVAAGSSPTIRPGGSDAAINLTLAGKGVGTITLGSALTSALSTASGGTGATTGATSLCMGASASVGAATTDFAACGENAGDAVIAVEANAQVLIPAACTVSNLYVQQATAANANTPVYTVDKGGVAQSLTCPVLNAATTCNDTIHSFTTAAGNLLSIKVANPAAANATGVINFGFQINC